MPDSVTKEKWTRGMDSILRFCVYRAKFYYLQSPSLLSWSITKQSTSFLFRRFSCPRRSKGNTFQAEDVKCGWQEVLEQSLQSFCPWFSFFWISTALVTLALLWSGKKRSLFAFRLEVFLNPKCLSCWKCSVEKCFSVRRWQRRWEGVTSFYLLIKHWPLGQQHDSIFWELLEIWISVPTPSPHIRNSGVEAYWLVF